MRWNEKSIPFLKERKGGGSSPIKLSGHEMSDISDDVFFGFPNPDIKEVIVRKRSPWHDFDICPDLDGDPRLIKMSGQEMSDIHGAS